MRNQVLLASLVSSILTVGCGDMSGSTGELGRLNYALHSDFEVDGAALVGTPILTGHAQRINVDLTPLGSDETSSPADIQHVVSPSGGVTMEAWESTGDVSDFEINVATPGDYVIESMLGEDTFDRITLTFDAPSSMELVTWIRRPNADDFDEATGSPIAVDEGAQAAFVPIPLDSSGVRIAGDFVPTIDADAPWAIVQGVNVLGIYEQNVVVAQSPASVYFIEPGPISIAIGDDVNGVEGVAEFDVAPVLVPPGR